MSSYQDHVKDFEPRWQQAWAERDLYRTPNPGETGFDPAKPKYYVLDMFPYPSGAGLHVGHPLGYIGTDVYARFLRMRGFNVLHTMGFDAFGLPAEQYAIQTGQHPAVTTANNIATMQKQLRQISLAHDPQRAVSTADPAFYRWTQWIFLQLFNSFYDPTVRWTGPDGHENVGRARPIHELAELLRQGAWVVDESGTPAAVGGATPQPRDWDADELAAALDKARLAYVAEVPVNWCPQLGTVLANEEVTNEGKSERGNFPVFKRPLRQWVLRITAYADRLIGDLDDLAWPHSVVEMQKNWIGRSVGAEVQFPVAPAEATEPAGGLSLARSGVCPSEPIITVFTTRPDTLFGATYMVLAPEHPLVEQITTEAQKIAVQGYVAQAKAKTDVQRMEDAAAGHKSGVFTGTCAVNPVNGEKIPVWVADYVLMGYGTGAIMAVPAHDERDFAFAQAFELPIRAVVMPDDAWLKQAAVEYARRRAASDPRIDQATGGNRELAEQVRKGVADRAAEAFAKLDEAGLAQLREEYVRHAGRFGQAFTGDGVGVNSANAEVSLNGLPVAEAKTAITAWLAGKGLGRATTQYKLRDWLFSRQRYWGEPFPVVYDRRGRCWPLDDSELPVTLPDLTDFSPRSSDDPESLPEPPLARAAEWVNVTGVLTDRGTVKLAPQGEVFRRDVNTMPNWAGSCWYYLRYCDPANAQRFVGADAERYWMVSKTGSGKVHAGGVDLYVGGTEHAVLHLLYSRFWHKVLYDLGQVTTREPFGRLFNQGMITADAFTDSRGVYVDVREVELRGPEEIPYHKTTGEQLTREPGKMGKSLKNAVSPEEVIEQYSVDVFRLYEMYMGPLDASRPWITRDIIGMQRFCNAVWRLVVDTPRAESPSGPAADDADRLVHKTIKRVTENIADLKLNTAIAALIELTNALGRARSDESGGDGSATLALGVPQLKALVLMLAPFAPHLAEELYHRLDPAEHEQIGSVYRAAWPAFDPAKCVDSQLEVPVTVNGKLKAKVTVPADADDAAIQSAALAHEAVARTLDGRTPAKIIVARKGATPLVNLVVK